MNNPITTIDFKQVLGRHAQTASSPGANGATADADIR